MAMHLASMVHGSVREREAFQQQPQHSAYYQQSQHRGYPVSGAAPSSFTQQQQLQPQHVEHHYQRQRPQSPPSPPAEETKPSLPSISSLLEFAGSEKTASETGKHSLIAPSSATPLTAVAVAQSPQSQHRQSSSPQLRQAQQGGAGAMQQQQLQPHSQTIVYAPLSAASNPRMTLPPTPPMHPDGAHDGNQSPSAASSHSTASGPYFVGGSLNNMEPHHQRQAFSSVPPPKRDALQSHSMSPYSASMYGNSPYQSSPGAASSASFYSPDQHPYNPAAMYGQRSLPSSYQPHGMPLPVPAPSPAPNGSNPWQHHHYISTSSQSQFPQSQDRYICSTCSKAFSRPSSLRIHSHSHTGEKPYKCPQPGCGKAFSVRSNMKRHERGCHAASSTILTT